MVVSGHLLIIVLDAAAAGKITDAEVLKAQFGRRACCALVAKIGENINIQIARFLEGDGVLGFSCQHGARIGVLVAAKGADQELG